VAGDGGAPTMNDDLVDGSVVGGRGRASGARRAREREREREREGELGEGEKELRPVLFIERAGEGEREGGSNGAGGFKLH
jgi:hypothetical protein